MHISQIASTLGRAPARPLRAGKRVDTPMGKGKIEREPEGADVMYLVRLDRPFELRRGTPVERSAFFSFELEAA